MLDRWGYLVARRPRSVLLSGLLVALVAGLYGVGVFGSLSNSGFGVNGSESERQGEVERALFGNSDADVLALYRAEDGRAGPGDPAFDAAVADAVAGLPEDAVVKVTSYAEVPPGSGLVSTDGEWGQVVISLAGDGQGELMESYDEVQGPLTDGPGAAGLEVRLAGPWSVFDDVTETTAEDLKRAEIISLPIVLMLALLFFGSAVAASMPVLVGLLATVGGLALTRLLTQVTEVSVFAVNVITLLGIGLAIDYALFVVSRFREELARGLDPAAATHRTVVTAGRTVLFSGLTVAAALASLLVFPLAFMSSVAYGGVVAVLVAVLVAITVLPATLCLLGPRVDAGRLPWRRGRPVSVDSPDGGWARVARAVMRRPLVVVVVLTAALLVVASPFLGARFGTADYRILPEDSPARVAAATLAEEFGAETATAEIVVTGVDETSLASYVDALGEVGGEGADGATPVDVQVLDTTSEDGGAALLRASWSGNGQSQASQDLLRHLRDVRPEDGEALVGGVTAESVDTIDSLADRLPAMVTVMVAVMLVLLFLAFGSVVLPVKAVLMNVLSITAAFGVVTWIFADGNLAGLLAFEPLGFLDATNPILMLAVLFGLSMDYEVFLLSRVREEWDTGASNTDAVAVGLQKTGKIITSAALLLGVVIGAFGTSGIVLIKMIGVGMIVALFIDATVVRALLVPATMRLLGDWNWYAPGPLRRWWERHGHHEGPRPTGRTTPAASPR
ncbi:MMPL family transporter [Nocardioides sp. CFH 31398]|uniref:MMPL family transporter n=1 Tax=Nocardioides sp. CFH 31398 TaxID=2919579 RepID=UPI001F0700E9|nr:MMPL family transporter [Nocardioides sp. CFH 31398]MCH1865391.1 MMPL family transporter [Nocardioides sp. CFH 31398]